MTLPSKWYRDRGAQCPNINFSTPCLSLKFVEQGSAYSGRRLYKHRQQQQIKSCHVCGLRSTVPPPQILAPAYVRISHLMSLLLISHKERMPKFKPITCHHHCASWHTKAILCIVFCHLYVSIVHFMLKRLIRSACDLVNGLSSSTRKIVFDRVHIPGIYRKLGSIKHLLRG